MGFLPSYAGVWSRHALHGRQGPRQRWMWPIGVQTPSVNSDVATHRLDSWYLPRKSDLADVHLSLEPVAGGTTPARGSFHDCDSSHSRCLSPELLLHVHVSRDDGELPLVVSPPCGSWPMVADEPRWSPSEVGFPTLIPSSFYLGSRVRLYPTLDKSDGQLSSVNDLEAHSRTRLLIFSLRPFQRQNCWLKTVSCLTFT